MKITLNRSFFAEAKRTLVEDGELKAELFRYASGIEAVRVSNRRGSFTVLPWMGQMIWRCDFDGRELVMKSIWDEPAVCKASYEESYGCFLMHCGLTAMGNPTAADTHPGHGELPAAVYGEAWLEVGADKAGPFLAVSGVYRHKRCYALDYAFSPRALLRPGKATVEVTSTITNDRDLPLEYYYLCHVNHRPVDGSSSRRSASRRSSTTRCRPTTTSHGATRRTASSTRSTATTASSASWGRRAKATVRRSSTATSTGRTRRAGRS